MAAGQGQDGTTMVRVGDTERERVRLVLSRHAEDGRITLEEYGDRLGEVYAARTAPELQDALRELPPLPAGATPVLPAERIAARRRARAGVAAFVGFVALMLTIWALSGAGYFWPVWPIMGVGLSALGAAREGRGRSGAHPRRDRPGMWGAGMWGGGWDCDADRRAARQ